MSKSKLEYNGWKLRESQERQDNLSWGFDVLSGVSHHDILSLHFFLSDEGKSAIFPCTLDVRTLKDETPVKVIFDVSFMQCG